MRDVVVVGGGPAGSRSAALLARDADVVVLEEHPRSGVPMQCAGLITDDVIELSGVRPDILSTLFGAEVVFPDGTALTVRSDNPKARAVDRADLDSKMADAAMAAGAEYMFGTRFLSSRVSDRVSVDTTAGGIDAALVVGADGHTSSVSAGIPGSGPREYLRGIQADVAWRPDHDDLFRIHLGSRYAPGFFTWEIPCGDFTRVGLCTSWEAGPPMQYLRRLLEDLGAEDRVVGMHGGKIPLHGRGRIVGDRTMLVGDAASQVKPVSGGGLYPGLTAAGVLADVAGRALSDGDLSAGRLSEYERRCDRDFGSELRRGYTLRRMFVRMSDEDLTAAGRFASRDDVRSVLDDIDIDHPSAVVRGLLAHPSAALSAVPLVLRCLV